MCIKLLLTGFLFSVLQAAENNDNIPKTLEERVKEMERNFHFLSKRNSDIETKFDSLFKDYVDLKEKFHKVDSDNNGLRNDVVHLRHQNKKLENQVLTLQNETLRKFEIITCKCDKRNNMKLSKSAKNRKYGSESDRIMHSWNPSRFLQQLLPNQDKQRQEGKTAVKRITSSGDPVTLRISSPHVAFHATMSKRFTHASDDQLVEFSNVMTNVGNGYDGASSTFVCPTSGTYVFYTTIQKPPNAMFGAVIVRNGDVINSLYADDSSGSASNMVVINLQSRDTVWVKLNGFIHSAGDLALEQYSTFSGFILWSS